MKVIAVLLLLMVGAGSLWAYGMMGGNGMMGRYLSDGDALGAWGFMAAMHNSMHGTNFTGSQLRLAMEDFSDARGYAGGMMGGYEADGGAQGFGCH